MYAFRPNLCCRNVSNAHSQYIYIYTLVNANDIIVQNKKKHKMKMRYFMPISQYLF